MSTTGVLVGGRRSRLSAARLRRFASVAWNPQSYRNLLYLALALPLGVGYVAVLAAGLSSGAAGGDPGRAPDPARHAVRPARDGRRRAHAGPPPAAHHHPPAHRGWHRRRLAPARPAVAARSR